MKQFGRGLSAKIVKDALPLQGVEKDEIASIISNIKRADSTNRVGTFSEPRQQVSAEISALLEEWQLPSEALDYFVIDKV